METISAALKRAIERDARPFSVVAAAAGVDKGQVSRFLRGERTLTLETADLLCRALGVDVRLVRSKKVGD